MSVSFRNIVKFWQQATRSVATVFYLNLTIFSFSSVLIFLGKLFVIFIEKWSCHIIHSPHHADQCYKNRSHRSGENKQILEHFYQFLLTNYSKTMLAIKNDILTNSSVFFNYDERMSMTQINLWKPNEIKSHIETPGHRTCEFILSAEREYQLDDSPFKLWLRLAQLPT